MSDVVVQVEPVKQGDYGPDVSAVKRQDRGSNPATAFTIVCQYVLRVGGKDEILAEDEIGRVDTIEHVREFILAIKR